MFGIGLIVLSFGYVNSMVSYKYEVDLMETNIETDDSLSVEQKKHLFADTEKRKNEILDSQKIIRILFFIFLIIFVFFLYLLWKKSKS